MATNKFRTTAVYLSGGICGHMWWPQSLAGFGVNKRLRGPFGLMGRSSGRESFEDTLSLFLMENGGDFQNAQFTSDTEIVIDRRRDDGNGKYTVHTRTIPLADHFPDLVNAECDMCMLSTDDK